MHVKAPRWHIQPNASIEPVSIAHQALLALAKQDTVAAAAPTSGAVRKAFSEGRKQRTANHYFPQIPR